jgi:hypothetical protein
LFGNLSFKHEVIEDQQLISNNTRVPASAIVSARSALRNAKLPSGMAFFEEQLDGWYRVRSSSPTRRDRSAFEHWFEWSFHSVLFDLGHDPLLEEEI